MPILSYGDNKTVTTFGAEGSMLHSVTRIKPWKTGLNSLQFIEFNRNTCRSGKTRSVSVCCKDLLFSTLNKPLIGTVPANHFYGCTKYCRLPITEPVCGKGILETELNRRRTRKHHWEFRPTTPQIIKNLVSDVTMSSPVEKKICRNASVTEAST